MGKNTTGGFLDAFFFKPPKILSQPPHTTQTVWGKSRELLENFRRILSDDTTGS
jgi:hypothetical protein